MISRSRVGVIDLSFISRGVVLYKGKEGWFQLVCFCHGGEVVIVL